MDMFANTCFGKAATIAAWNCCALQSSAVDLEYSHLKTNPDLELRRDSRDSRNSCSTQAPWMMDSVEIAAAESRTDMERRDCRLTSARLTACHGPIQQCR